MRAGIRERNEGRASTAVDAARCIDPERYALLNGRRWAADAFYNAYLVFWPEALIGKAGYSSSGSKRWRKFVRLGAVVVDLYEFDGWTAALDFETTLDNHLSAAGVPAFADRFEAEPYLGREGAGWTECWRIPNADVLADRPVVVPEQGDLGISLRIP